MTVLLEYSSPTVEVRWSCYDSKHRVEVGYVGSFRIYWFDTEKQAEAFINGLGI